MMPLGIALLLSILHIASDKSDIHRNEVSMIRIGTRKSKLALIQTELVKAQILKYFPNEKIEIVHVVTHGDKVLDKPLGEIGGKGVFTKEIEEKLLDKTIDIAVHSAKDVPMELADGLCLGAVLLRDDNRDVILKRKETGKIGAGSIKIGRAHV